MAHIEEGTLQAYLDHEVAARAEVESHLAQCAACAAELERLRSASQLFASVLRGRDTVPPAISAYAAVKATRGPEVQRQRPAMPRIPLARAAMLLVGLAAVASATIPGSPVREWLSDAFKTVGPEQNEVIPAPVATPPAPAAAEEGGVAAISIEPAEGRVLVILSDAAPDATVRVRLADTPRASVRVTDAAARTRFRTGPGRIEVVGLGSSEVTVEIPRAALDARVEVDGRLVFQKDRNQLHLSEPPAASDSEFIFKRNR